MLRCHTSQCLSRTILICPSVSTFYVIGIAGISLQLLTPSYSLYEVSQRWKIRGGGGSWGAHSKTKRKDSLFGGGIFPCSAHFWSMAWSFKKWTEHSHVSAPSHRPPIPRTRSICGKRRSTWDWSGRWVLRLTPAYCSDCHRTGEQSPPLFIRPWFVVSIKISVRVKEQPEVNENNNEKYFSSQSICEKKISEQVLKFLVEEKNKQEIQRASSVVCLLFVRPPASEDGWQRCSARVRTMPSPTSCCYLTQHLSPKKSVQKYFHFRETSNYQSYFWSVKEHLRKQIYEHHGFTNGLIKFGRNQQL